MTLESPTENRHAGPVFDGHVALGRRHDKRAVHSTAAELIAAIDRAGIDRALAYSPHAVAYDTWEGNQLLLDILAKNSRIVPQFVANLASERDVGAFMQSVADAGVRSIRIHPKDHLYPLTSWVLSPWAEMLHEQQIALWLPMDQADPRDIHDTATAHSELNFVLLGVHYSHFAVLQPLLKACPNLYVDLSRYDVPDGLVDLSKLVGSSRLLYGSNWPDLDPAPYLWYVKRSGLSPEEQAQILSGNLEKLMGGSVS